MPTKAAWKPTTPPPRRIGRPPSGSCLAELWACLRRQTREIAKLSRERDRLADGTNQKAMACNRHLLAEASDKWWTCIDKITGGPV
jgi:hypothetical protein